MAPVVGAGAVIVVVAGKVAVVYTGQTVEART
jgi:hypothetical protein